MVDAHTPVRTLERRVGQSIPVAIRPPMGARVPKAMMRSPGSDYDPVDVAANGLPAATDPGEGRR